MRYLNEQLVIAYKRSIYEAISREMMPEPSIAPDGIIGSATEAGGRIAREIIAQTNDFLQFKRNKLHGISLWLKDLIRRGLFDIELNKLFRDPITGHLYILDTSTNPALMRKIKQDSLNPNGWAYDDAYPPVPMGNGKKPWYQLEQYQSRQVGDHTVGGWGKPSEDIDPQMFWNTNTLGGLGLGIGAGYLMLQNPDSGFNDVDGDGIPDTIDSDSYGY